MEIQIFRQDYAIQALNLPLFFILRNPLLANHYIFFCLLRITSPSKYQSGIFRHILPLSFNFLTISFTFALSPSAFISFLSPFLI